MFIEAGDTVRGRDGQEWLVLSVVGATLTLWRHGRPVWSGKPRNAPPLVRLHDETTLNARIAVVPGPEVTRAVGATMASLIRYTLPNGAAHVKHRR